MSFTSGSKAGHVLALGPGRGQQDAAPYLCLQLPAGTLPAPSPGHLRPHIISSSPPRPHAKHILRCPGCDGAIPAAVSAWDRSALNPGQGLPWTDLPRLQLRSHAGNALVHTHTAYNHIAYIYIASIHNLPTVSQLKPQA